MTRRTLTLSGEAPGVKWPDPAPASEPGSMIEAYPPEVCASCGKCPRCGR